MKPASEPLRPPNGAGAHTPTNTVATEVMPMTNESGGPKPASRGSQIKRWLPLAVMLSVMGLVFIMGWHKALTFENLALKRDVLRAYVQAHTVLALAMFMAAYIAVVALSMPVVTAIHVPSGDTRTSSWSPGSRAISRSAPGSASASSSTPGLREFLVRARACRIPRRRKGWLRETRRRRGCFWYPRTPPLATPPRSQRSPPA